MNILDMNILNNFSLDPKIQHHKNYKYTLARFYAPSAMKDSFRKNQLK